RVSRSPSLSALGAFGRPAARVHLRRPPRCAAGHPSRDRSPAAGTLSDRSAPQPRAVAPRREERVVVSVKIRLMRVGKKKQPTYRVVVADGRSPRDGRFIEIIGRYAPRDDPSAVEIDAESALAWLRKGAQP